MNLLRNPLLIPAAIVLGAAVGFGVCRVMGVILPKRDIAVAVAATTIAAAAGFLPCWLLRKSTQATLANACLGGTLIHTMVTVGIMFAWWMTGRSGNINAFWMMLLPLYWLSLAALATVTIMMVRAVPVKPIRPVTAPPRRAS